MKLLFDQNFPHRLVALLAAEYPDSAHVRDVGLAAAEDEAVWDYAKSNGFAVTSKDSDFQQRALLLGAPPKVIWLRVGNCSTSEVEELLRDRQPDVLVFDADPSASILALS